MGLRKILQEVDPAPAEIVVEHQGESLLLRARDDAGVYTKAFFVDATEQKLRALRWQGALKAKGLDATIDEDAIWQIMLVHAHLVPEDPAHPYDPVEIAEVYARKGGLFMLLFQAACEISSIGKDSDFVGSMARKNSEASQAPSAPSKPRPSRRRASL